MIILLLFMGPAWADEESDREEDLFGSEETEEEETEGAAAGEGTEAPLAQPLTTDAQIASVLSTADERLTVGGQLWLRLDATVPEALDDPGDLDWSSPSFLDLFVDARPNDRVRAFVNGRVVHDWTVLAGETDAYGNERVATSVALDQLWLKGDAWRKVYFTVGKQRVKWGSGRFWNPTDFLHAQRLDPLAVFDQRTGVALVRAHMPVGAANLYAVANLDGASTVGQVGGAARAEVVFGTTELSATAAVRKDQPLRLGADLSTGFWLLDLRIEAAVLHGVDDPFYEGTLDLSTFTLPTEVDRSDDWIPQVVAGLEGSFKLGDEDSLTLGVEGFFNDAGTDQVELYPWLLINDAYSPFYVGRWYLAGYLYLPAPGRWDETSFTASWIANLSDSSHVARLDASVTALTWLSLNAYVAPHFGQVGELRYRLQMDPVPGVEGLEDGIDVPAPVVDVGLGARVRF